MMSPKRQQAGFGLFEILITIVIVAIGLLGLAAMQATGLKNNQSAYRSSQATFLAYDIADRMRTNTSAISSYLMGPDEATEKGVTGGCYSTTGCTAAQLAANDLNEWNAALNADLPGAVGSIVLAGDVYTISVRWDDNLDGTVNSDDPNFQVSFTPQVVITP